LQWKLLSNLNENLVTLFFFGADKFLNTTIFTDRVFQ